MDDFNSLQPNECYNKLNKDRSCSKYNIAVAQDNYQGIRTVFKLC